MNNDWPQQDLEACRDFRAKATGLLHSLMTRAYMRLDYHEADEIAEFLGVKKPTDHEMEDLR
jgi:hypothetical protein